MFDYRYQSEHTPTLSNLGTTAEIFSIKDETDDISGISTVRVKAKGRQRFEVIDTHREVTGYASHFDHLVVLRYLFLSGS